MITESKYSQREEWEDKRKLWIQRRPKLGREASSLIAYIWRMVGLCGRQQAWFHPCNSSTSSSGGVSLGLDPSSMCNLPWRKSHVADISNIPGSSLRLKLCFHSSFAALKGSLRIIWVARYYLSVRSLLSVAVRKHSEKKQLRV